MATVPGAVTPMMAQFLDIKSGYPDALLFYRMGDFYEMFFEDAVLAADALDIALTKRGKHLGKDIPMCGVPAHSSDNYLLTLIRKGFRVAVCDQLEDPAEAKKRGSKSVVKRGVVRLVTPGTLTEDSLLDARQHNYLCAFAEVRGNSSLAWVDISTGDFLVQSCPKAAVAPLLARLAPKELLVAQDPEEWLRICADDCRAAITELGRTSFDSASATQRLQALFGVQSLDAFGVFERPDLAAMGAIVDYLDITQKGKLPILRPPVLENARSAMRIDAATRRNLELTRTLSGERKGSLLGVVDQTITGAGARLLEMWLNNPSTDLEMLQSRLDVVQYFTESGGGVEEIYSALKQAPDMDRALTRLSLERGGPRDMASVRAGLQQALSLTQLLDSPTIPADLRTALDDLLGHEDLTDLLAAALEDEPPLQVRDGGFVRTAYSEDLAEARTLRDEGRKIISALQSKYSDDAQIQSLKIKHNNVLGYFIETPSRHADRMLSPPLSETFIHRQTTANAIRFTTLELSDLETRILNAGSWALEIEKSVFDQLRESILSYAHRISAAARAIAVLDVQSSLARRAVEENWVRPVLSRDRAFKIVDGRHPVVDDALKRGGTGTFVANSCDLSCDSTDAKWLWLLTGPNMAGKSTFLRQNALIAILAQMGSFVPAESAQIGLVSQLFSRVGASDDLARGRSTFMVEMVETAAILNQADENALVILDEIGRGTATYDGLSIAWATLEHLHEVNGCRTIFATHYHELTHLSAKLNNMMNATIAVREWDGDIIFLHEVTLGAADRSYGVQVAQLAGLPTAVVERARIVLEALEKGDRGESGKAETLFEDLPLFAVRPASNASDKEESLVEASLEKVLPDELTPKEALALVYELKSLLKS